jgi:hypothetical protein
MQRKHGIFNSFPQHQAASPYRAASSFQPFASALDDVLRHDNWQDILSKAFEDVSTDGADFAEAVDALPGGRSEGVRLDWPDATVMLRVMAARFNDPCTNGTGHTRVRQCAFLSAMFILAVLEQWLVWRGVFFATNGSAILESQSQ